MSIAAAAFNGPMPPSGRILSLVDEASGHRRDAEYNMPEYRALITGACGFSGRHLGAYLLRQGCAVSGIDLSPSTPDPEITVHAGDIRDLAFVREIILKAQPTHVFHMAGLISSDAPLDELYDANVLGTAQVLKAAKQAGLDPAIVIPGSSAVYGRVEPADLPIRESQPFRPLTLYGVSKIAQEMLAYTYHARHGLKVIRTRAFNLVGPGLPPSLACSAFAKQIAEIEVQDAEPVLRVGNLAPQRDFVDVRDVARAYWLVAQRGQPGEVYNVCSGLGVSIQACLLEMLDLSGVTIKVQQDGARVRSSDIPVSVGDGSLLRKQTDWYPMIPLEKSLAGLLEYWRQRVHEV